MQLFRRPHKSLQDKSLQDNTQEREDKIRFAPDEMVRKAARRIFAKYKLTMRRLAE